MSEFTSVTRCPYCKTSFHLGPLQLQAAGGKVRCGACLNIFDAKSHFLVEQKYLFDSPLPLPSTSQVEAEDLEPEIEELLEQETEEEDEIYPVMTAANTRAPTSRLWGPLALVAVLTLPIQLFWWQPTALLEQRWYQDFLRQSCATLPCEMTSFQDIEYVSLTGLIQPSNTHKQVLTALLELRNQAPLPQPFPALSLRFMNLRGDPVSSRIFEPSEYLQAEASGRRFMDPNSRTQIELEIYDPGGDAISYEFEPLYLSSSSQR